MAKLKPIGLSFKNNVEDEKLYNWIYQHSNISGFIKDILKKEMNRTDNRKIEKEINNKDNLINLSDF